MLGNKKNIRSRFAICLIVPSLISLSYFPTDANASTRNYFNSWERGSYDYWNSYNTLGISWDLWWVVRSIKDRNKRHTNNWKRKHPDDAWSQRDERTYRKRQCDLTKSWKYSIRKARSSISTEKLTIYHPWSIDKFVDSVAAARDHVDRLNTAKRCKAISYSQLDKTVSLTQAIMKEDNALNVLKQKRRRSASWSNTFSVELSPIPLRIEFIEGSAKLRFSGVTGPFRWTGLSGISVNSDDYNGLARLVLITPGNNTRIFDVAGIDFEIMLPKSRLEVRGNTAYITCSKNCADDLKLSG